jgi:minor extracellular serine protease Vpr
MPHTPHSRWARRALGGLGAAALMAATLAPGASGADPEEPAFLGSAEDLGVVHPGGDEGTAHIQSDAWFVQLKGQPTAAGGNASSVKATQRQFEREARAAGADLEVTRSYGKVWQGVAVKGSEADVRKAARTSQVEAVFPVEVIEAPAPEQGEQPDMAYAVGMTGADVAQSELGLTGEGVKVAVMDTGIDYDHPDFGGNGSDGSTGFPTERVAYGYDFVGDSYNADSSSEDYQPVPQPDGDPDDCQGHGTHVAGIVGADGEQVGVAPGSTLGAYRVFGCEGSTTADIMLAAMERAYDDGMDVLNMSIGSAFSTWKQYPTAAGADALVEAGMVVVASIGNSGAAGTWSAGSPGVGEHVIGVASFDNEFFTANAFTVSPDDRAVPYVVGSPAPEPPTEGTAPLSRLGDPGSRDAAACEPIDADLSGTVVLLQRGGGPAPAEACSFHIKAVNAQNAGAEAVVLYNNVAGYINPSLAGDPAVTIPFVSISRADGILIDERIVDGGAEMTWTDETATAPSPTGGLISSFSSYGMSAELELKPDLGAPGGQIYATYPLEKGGYATLSGTSMSSPHVAGAVALLLEEKPDTEAHDVRAMLQNHADPAVWSLNPGSGFIEPVHRQGAGMLDIDDTILATTSVSPGKLSLGESAAGGHEVTMTLHNEGTEALTYDVGHVGALATGGLNPNSPGFYLPLGSLDAPESVTVPAGGSTDVTVTIEDSGENLLAQYGGYVTFTSETSGTMRVPYAGFDGDYQELPVLEHPTFPALAQLTGCDRLIGVDCTMNGAWDLADEGTVFTMEGGDVPTAAVHLRHPARSATFEVYEANADGTKGDLVHPAFPVAMEGDYLARSGSANGFSAWAWDGTRDHNKGNDKRKTVPDGDYILELTVVKALGDASNPDHVETWTSPSFTIDRPDSAPGNSGGKGKGKGKGN